MDRSSHRLSSRILWVNPESVTVTRDLRTMGGRAGQPSPESRQLQADGSGSEVEPKRAEAEGEEGGEGQYGCVCTRKKEEGEE